MSSIPNQSVSESEISNQAESKNSSKTSTKPKFIKVTNRTSAPIELDFGRGKEVIVPSYKSASLEPSQLEDPIFLKVKKDFLIG